MPLRKEPQSLHYLAQDALLQLGEIVWQRAFARGLDCSVLDTPALRRFLSRFQAAVDESLTSIILNKVQASLVVVRQHPRIRPFLDALLLCLLNTKLKALDLCTQDPRIQDCVLQHLSSFQNLDRLRLGCRDGSALQESVKYVIDSAPCLTTVTHLCIHGICNRDMLMVVASSCRALRHLDIRYSAQVRDDDAISLTSCKSLRSLNFYGTSCTRDSISVLLTFLPLLQDIGSWDHLNDVIKAVTMRDPDTHHLNLAKFISNEVPAVFLEHLCRDIVELDLTLPSIRPTKRLPVFSILSKLGVDLRLGAASGINLLRVFRPYLTRTLTELHLNSSLIHKKDVTSLSRLAPYLRVLQLKHLSPEDDSHLNSTSRTFFNFLSRLHLVDVPLTLVELLLKSSPSLETCSVCLHKRSASPITDDFMASILAVNPLRRLEKLSLHADNTLTMLTVRILLNKCDSLRRIEALNAWGGITSGELDAFRQEIRRHNLALTVDP